MAFFFFNDHIASSLSERHRLTNYEQNVFTASFRLPPLHNTEGLNLIQLHSLALHYSSSRSAQLNSA